LNQYCSDRSEIDNGLTWLRVANGERIAREGFGATAYWIMIDHLAVCVLSTRAWARILTFIVQTRLCQRAIGADDTFWSAGRWIAYQTGLA
jgi:hypothetical protein